jgi:hypothetical protein
VYVFTLIAGDWIQQAYIKASNAGANDRFGQAVSISGDGTILAVSAYREDSNAIGVHATHAGADVDSADNASTTEETGAVYMFSHNGTTWEQNAYIKASNTEKDDKFGLSLSLSKDGLTLAVGAEWEQSSATGINGDESLNDLIEAGAAYVFARPDTASAWTQQAYVKASNPGDGDEFGRAISLSADGDTLAVGARFEDGDAVGINGVDNDSALKSGAMYIYTRSGGVWSTQTTYVKASNTDAGDEFGWSVSLTKNAAGLQTLAVGARFEDSNAQDTGGDQTNNDTSEAGAVYLY